jgi:hypothetical protein
METVIASIVIGWVLAILAILIEHLLGDQKRRGDRDE